MASVIDRVSLIVRSSVNDLISKFEDPAKIIDQAIVDEKVKYAKLLNEASATFGNESRAKKEYEKVLAKANDEHELAKKALEAGNESDAKKLLAKEQEYRKQADTLKISYDAVNKSASLIRQTLDNCRNNIKDMEVKSKEIKAKATATKAINQATSMAQTAKNIGTDDAFRRLQEKADKEFEAAMGKADYVNESAQIDSELENKYRDNSGDDSDTLLAELKAEMGK